MQHARQSLTSLKWRGIFFLESVSHSPNAAQHLVHPIHRVQCWSAFSLTSLIACKVLTAGLLLSHLVPKLYQG